MQILGLNKNGKNHIDSTLLMSKIVFYRFYQVHTGNKDYEKRGIRMLPAHKFCKELLLP